MGKETGIKWTDSTWNSWWGCTKVGPACDHCYAEGVDKRTGENHWGHGAPRRLLSDHARNEPYRWQRNADKFFAEHGRRQRVFTLSMGDLFDKEVPDDWRADHFKVMAECDKLEWQICTKRVSQIAKLVPAEWHPVLDINYAPSRVTSRWPRHIGVLITVVTQAEADRDVPRLLELKRRFGIPWVGISYEPAQELVDFSRFMWPVCTRWPSPYRNPEDAIAAGAEVTYHRQALVHAGSAFLDWIIFGGKSGSVWNDRPFDVEWGRKTALDCQRAGTAFFFKQVAGFRPTDAMIPADLMIRQWPKGH